MPGVTKPQRVFGHPKGEAAPQVAIAPGQRFVPLPADPEPDRLLVYKLVHVGDNLYKAVAQAHDRVMLINSANIRQLGLGVSRKTLHRLLAGGFVKGGQISPQVYYLDLASYFAHLQACVADPHFWDDPERRRRYSEARAMVR